MSTSSLNHWAGNVKPPDPSLTLWYAMTYSRLGMRSIPLQPGAKVPLPGWKWKEPEPAEHAWLSFTKLTPTPTNIGIVCGNGWAVIDVDDPDGARSILPRWAWDALTSTWVVRTRRGFHAYFRAEPGSVRNVKRTVFEVRAVNAYVVAPPSIVNGHAYTWERGLKIHTETATMRIETANDTRTFTFAIPRMEREFEPLTLTPDLIEALDAVPTAHRSKPHVPNTDPTPFAPLIHAMRPFWVKGQRQNLALYLSGLMRKRGIPEKIALEAITHLARAFGDEERQKRIDAVHYTYRAKIIKGWSGLVELVGTDGALEIKRAVKRLRRYKA